MTQTEEICSIESCCEHEAGGNGNEKENLDKATTQSSS
jgi:hypothetical protein